MGGHQVGKDEVKTTNKELAAIQEKVRLSHDSGPKKEEGGTAMPSMAGLTTVCLSMMCNLASTATWSAELRFPHVGLLQPAREGVAGRIQKLEAITGTSLFSPVPVHVQDLSGECPHGSDSLSCSGVAFDVHGDADLYGEPVMSKSWGWAPLLFHSWSPLWTLNFWIPLQPILSNPLALMDVRYNKSKSHVLRPIPCQDKSQCEYADAWSVLPTAEHKWYSFLSMNQTSMLVFDTYRTPHAAFEMPGQDQLTSLSAVLQNCSSCSHMETAAQLCKQYGGGGDVALPAIAQAFVEEACGVVKTITKTCQGRGATSLLISEVEALAQLSHRIVRRSLEFRAIVIAASWQSSIATFLCCALGSYCVYSIRKRLTTQGSQDPCIS